MVMGKESRVNGFKHYINRKEYDPMRVYSL